MSEEERNKKIEALGKMFSTKDELKLSGEKKPVKKTNTDNSTPDPEDNEANRDLNLLEDEISFDIEKKTKNKKKEDIKEEAKKEEETANISSSPAKNFPLEKLKENLRPEIKEMVKKLESTVPKESVDKLINVMETNKNIIFDSSVTNVFDGLSAGEASLLGKKLAEWEVPKEASEINASVIVAWLNKTKK